MAEAHEQKVAEDETEPEASSGRQVLEERLNQEREEKLRQKELQNSLAGFMEQEACASPNKASGLAIRVEITDMLNRRASLMKNEMVKSMFGRGAQNTMGVLLPSTQVERSAESPLRWEQRNMARVLVYLLVCYRPYPYVGLKRR